MRRAWNLAASAFFAIPLAGGWVGSGTSTSGRALLVVLGVATLARPAWGLLLMCGLIPMIDPAVVASGSPLLAEQIVLAFIVAANIRLAFARDLGPGHLVRPGIVLGVVVLASSSLAVSSTQQLVTATPDVFLRALWTHLSTDYYGSRQWFGMVNDMMAWFEAIALALVAERLVRTSGAPVESLMRLLVVAGGALALFSGIHLLEIALGSLHPWQTALHTLIRTRFNSFYPDINAAASVYALFLAPGSWLAWRERGRLAAAATLALTLALWLAGSRAAFAAVVGTTGLAWARVTRPPKALVVGVALMAVVAVYLVSATSVRNASVIRATVVRVELARVALQLTAEEPLFGSGLRSFRQRSIAAITPEMHARFRTFFWRGENAHNNFLQILVELGVAGLLAFVLMLTPLLKSVWRRATPASSTASVAIGLGITAFLFTCLLGHPLLLDDIRWQFFFVLGVGTGLVAAPARAGGAGRALFVAAVACVIAATPMRMQAARRHTDLSGVVFGTSGPLEAGDGTIYRRFGTDATWYLDASTRAVVLRMRSEEENIDPCTVRVAIEGQVLSTPAITRDVWLPVAVPVSPVAPGRSLRLDMHVVTPECRIMVAPLTELP